jgi:hypothetical protein
MDVRVFLSILAVAAVPARAHAQQVYKCVSGKQVSYQSAPCPTGQAAKAWDATPVAEPSNAERWRLYRIQQQLDRRYASDRAALSAGGGYGASVPSEQSSYACESAKRQRAVVYEAAGLKRSFELSSQQDEQVRNACK